MCTGVIGLRREHCIDAECRQDLGLLSPNKDNFHCKPKVLQSQLADRGQVKKPL